MVPIPSTVQEAPIVRMTPATTVAVCPHLAVEKQAVAVCLHQAEKDEKN